jgi:hypothetical protein
MSSFTHIAPPLPFGHTRPARIFDLKAFHVF